MLRLCLLSLWHSKRKRPCRCDSIGSLAAWRLVQAHRAIQLQEGLTKKSAEVSRIRQELVDSKQEVTHLPFSCDLLMISLAEERQKFVDLGEELTNEQDAHQWALHHTRTAETALLIYQTMDAARVVEREWCASQDQQHVVEA